MTSISFEYEGKKYTLEFDRRTVIALENKGFAVNKVDSQPIKNLYLLWEGAFEKHHSNVAVEKRDEILSALGDKESLISTLVQMYSEPAMILVDNDEDETKKVKWEINKG